MSTLESQGFISEVKITPDMLDKISKGYCLISQEQAHRLMSLASERHALDLISPSETRDFLYADVQCDIKKIWTEVFGES